MFELLHDLAGAVTPDLRSDLAMVVAQGVLLEATEVHHTQTVFRAGLRLWRQIAKHQWPADVFLARMKEWNRLIQEERLGDLSFMRVLTKSQDEDSRPEFVYCFVDSERDEDPFASTVLARKHFHRLRGFAKLVKAFPAPILTRALTAVSGPFTPFLLILTTSQRSALLSEAEKTDPSPTLLQVRVKGLAAARYLKGCFAGDLQLPPKVAPLLQALVTCVRVRST